MSGGLTMDAAMDFGLVLRFLLKTLGAFAIIFIIAMVTPKLAQLVDGWIKKYRSNHDPAKDETYGVRSIYELPPRPREEADEEPSPEDALLSDLPEEMAEILREEPAPVFEPEPEPIPEPEIEPEPEPIPEPEIEPEPEPIPEPEIEPEPEPIPEPEEDDELDDEDDFDDEDDSDAPEMAPASIPAPAAAAEESIPWFLR